MNKNVRKLMVNTIIAVSEGDPTPPHRAVSGKVKFDWYESQIGEMLQEEDNQTDTFYEGVASIFANATRDLVSLCEREGITLEVLDD